MLQTIFDLRYYNSSIPYRNIFTITSFLTNTLSAIISQIPLYTWLYFLQGT